MVGLPGEEAWTRDCLRAALPGCAVDQDDDNSVVGMHNLAITYPDGAVGAVKVRVAPIRIAGLAGVLNDPGIAPGPAR